MIKLAHTFLLVFSLIVLIVGCDTSERNVTTGTIKYLSFEGGFYGIITDEGKNLDPINLIDEFKVDGLRIYVDYKIAEEQTSFHMWGTLIEIIQIKKL